MFFVICHNIRSLHNVGSIFRTADGAGVSRIYLCGITGAPPRKEISKVALGAENFVPWEKHRQTARLIKKLKKDGVKIVALEQSPDSVRYDKFKLRPLAGGQLTLVLGEETKGLPKKILDLCDAAIEIPMAGKKESLNVSVAFGIAAYEIMKKI